MFKILFNRKAPIVRLFELAGLVGSYFYLKGGISFSDPTTLLFLFYLFLYLTVRLCDLIPWHLKDQSSFWQREIGIRVHFSKVLVATSYLLAINASLSLLDVRGLSIPFLIITNLFILAAISVNGILIYFHFKDKETLPINFFSHNKYLQ